MGAVKWVPAASGRAVTWYKVKAGPRKGSSYIHSLQSLFPTLSVTVCFMSCQRYFDEPDGEDPVVLDMSSMGKGMIFVNGEGMGRYWASYRTAGGVPSQGMYGSSALLNNPFLCWPTMYFHS